MHEHNMHEQLWWMTEVEKNPSQQMVRSRTLSRRSTEGSPQDMRIYLLDFSYKNYKNYKKL